MRVSPARAGGINHTPEAGAAEPAGPPLTRGGINACRARGHIGADDPATAPGSGPRGHPTQLIDTGERLERGHPARTGMLLRWARERRRARAGGRRVRLTTQRATEDNQVESNG